MVAGSQCSKKEKGTTGGVKKARNRQLNLRELDSNHRPVLSISPLVRAGESLFSKVIVCDGGPFQIDEDSFKYMMNPVDSNTLYYCNACRAGTDTSI